MPSDPAAEELETLIERLTKAEAGSDDLDLAIAEWCFANGAIAGVNYDPQLWIIRNGGEFTTSVDTALALVPEGMNYILGRGRTRSDEPLFGAQILHDQTVITEGETDAGLATAICIAALRARASLRRDAAP